MATGFLLSRVLMRFGTASDDLVGQISAAALTPDGSLWVASDELTTVERLSPVGPSIYGEHRSFRLGDFIDLPEAEGEIDIEGLDYSHHYVWITGSHSPRRKKIKGKKVAKDIQRLARIEPQHNRYVVARIPVVNGEPCRACVHPDHPERELRAARLRLTDQANELAEALQNDVHLGPFVGFNLPTKENGLDIEGLAVHGTTLLMGLRGPVLDRWAIILELSVEETEPGTLTLRPLEDGGRCYRKHFVNLDGLGIRELCLHGDDLLILAGPTMALEGAMKVFRLRHALGQTDDTLVGQEPGRLELVFDVPFTLNGDRAEGMALVSCLGQDRAVMLVYDTPVAARHPGPGDVFADVFRLE